MLDNSCCAIIAAGGAGLRTGLTAPKQFFEVFGKPIIAYTLDKFEQSLYVNDIIIVVCSGYEKLCAEIVQKYACRKVSRIVTGGDNRRKSVFNALKEVRAGTALVLVHDAARPFVTSGDIENVVLGIRRSGCSVLAVPVKETVKVVDKAIGTVETPDRDTLYAAQTPQGFTYEVLLQAHIKAESDGFDGFDDSSLTERAGVKTTLVEGGYHNFKITTAEDIVLAERLLQGFSLT